MCRAWQSSLPRLWWSLLPSSLAISTLPLSLLPPHSRLRMRVNTRSNTYSRNSPTVSSRYRSESLLTSLATLDSPTSTELPTLPTTAIRLSLALLKSLLLSPTMCATAVLSLSDSTSHSMARPTARYISTRSVVSHSSLASTATSRRSLPLLRASKACLISRPTVTSCNLVLTRT